MQGTLSRGVPYPSLSLLNWSTLHCSSPITGMLQRLCGMLVVQLCGSIAVGQHLDLFQSSRDRNGKKGIAGKKDRM